MKQYYKTHEYLRRTVSATGMTIVAVCLYFLLMRPDVIVGGLK